MAYIGNSPANIQRGRRAIYEFTSTAGQTAYSGLDDNNQVLDLLEANEQSVFLNGIRLIPTDDYTVSGDTLTLTSAASVNDLMVIETQAEVGNAVTYTRTESDARYVNYNGDIISGNVQIVGSLTATDLAVDTDVLVVDATNNRVGIGTSSPSRLLTVSPSTGSAQIGLVSQDSSLSEVLFGDAADDNVGRVYYDHASNFMSLWTNASEAMRIDSSGKVGIGVTNPSIYYSNANNLVVGDTADTAGITIASGFNYDGYLAFADGTSGDAAYKGYIRYSHVSTNSMMFGTNSAERMRIDSSGNVGIGTSSLDVSGNGSDYVGLSVIETSGSRRGFIEIGDNQNADTGGIGDINFVGHYQNAGHKVMASIKSAADGSTSGQRGANVKIFTKADGSSSLTERMRISSSGNVGIGTSNPSQVLHVASTTSNPTGIGLSNSQRYYAIRSNDYSLVFTDATVSQERMRIDSSGNLLVGTTTYNGPGNASSGDYGVALREEGILTAGANASESLVLNRMNSDGDLATFKRSGSTVGSIGVEGADLTIGTGTNSGLQFFDGGSSVRPFNMASNSRVDNAIDLGESNTRFRNLYLSGGIQFDSRSNKLDDYEEGSWTPRLKGDSNSNFFNLTAAQGSYVKIGNQVTVNFMIAPSSMNGSSGILQIRDLPFTIYDAMSATGIEANGTGAYWAAWATSINHLSYTAEGNTNILYIYGTTSGTQPAVSNLTAAHMGNSGAIRGSITYRTT